MIFYTRPCDTLTPDALKCARNVSGYLVVGDGIQVSGNENDYQVWHVRPGAYLIIPVERLVVTEVQSSHPYR